MASSLRRVSQRASVLTRRGIEREEFVAALGHDLMQPLSALRVASQLIGLLASRGATDSAQLVQCAERVERSVDRMTRLVNAVVRAAELDLAPVQIERAPTELGAVARGVADALGLVAEKAGVTVEVAPVSGVLADCDPTWIGEVLLNLVGNAVRHSPRDGRVRVTIEPAGNAVRCAVEDEGVGVAPAAREHLFERFARHGAHAGRAGLGLYIARRIVELHGGRIWLDTSSPRGARFVFDVPAARAEVPFVA
jgi:two-component system sensor histidine kinase BaeS